MRLNQQFSDEFLRVTAGLSLRQVRTRTGIDIDTVSRMRDGDAPRMDKIIIFARAFREPVNKWLLLAGYEPIEVTPGEAARMIAAAYSDGSLSESDLEKVLGPIEGLRARKRQARGEE